MIAEFFLVGVALALIALCGIGLSAWAVSGGRLSARAMALAPASGLALFGFLGFSLYRYVGPFERTAWPAAAALAAAGAAVVAAGHGFARRMPGPAELRRAALGTLVTGAVAVLVAMPLITGGIQYAAFQSNPSDAYFFQSFAESLRTVDWPTLAGGAGSIEAAGDGVRRLAVESPTALFTARFINIPLTLGNSAALSWISELVNVPVHRFYLGYNLLCFIAAFPAACVLARECGARRWASIAAGVAVALGYWAHHVLVSDSSAQIYAVPVSVLIAVLWVRAESSEGPLFSAPRAAAAVALAGLLGSNPAFPPLLVPAFVFYYGSAALFRRVSWRAAAGQITAGLLAVGLLAATGQFDYLWRCYQKFIFFVQSRTYAYDPGVFTHALGSNFFIGAWGFRPIIERGILPVWALGPVLTALGILLTAALLGFVAQGFGRDAPPAKRVTASLIAASWALSAFALFSRNYFSSMMAFEYAYPFFTVAVASRLTGDAKPSVRHVKKTLTTLIGVWLMLQCVLGLRWVREAAKFAAPGADSLKAQSYNVDTIISALDKRSPRLLYIDIPSDESWTFPLYGMFVFARYPSYFARGLVDDNHTKGVKRLFALERMPDYAVTTRASDFIGPRGWGRAIAETRDLVLYEITGGSLADFKGARPL